MRNNRRELLCDHENLNFITDHFAFSHAGLPDGLMEVATYRTGPNIRTVEVWGKDNLRPEGGQTLIAPTADGGAAAVRVFDKVGLTRRPVRCYALCREDGVLVVKEAVNLIRDSYQSVLDLQVGMGYVKQVESANNRKNLTQYVGTGAIDSLGLNTAQMEEMLIVPETLAAIEDYDVRERMAEVGGQVLRTLE